MSVYLAEVQCLDKKLAVVLMSMFYSYNNLHPLSADTAVN